MRLSPGNNRIVARGLNVNDATEDCVEWQLGPEATRAIRIDSGALVAGKAQDRRFGSDTFFDGGTAGTIDTAANYGAPPKRRAVAGTPDRDIVATYREGNFGYRVPLGNGRYVVMLTFMEPSAAPAARRFDVLAGGKRVINGMDVAAEAGAPMTAITRSFRARVTDGQLDLRFVPIAGQAIVSAVEITLAE